jgi:hypothetical protein
MPVMTDEHKAALATGRKEGRIVKAYLEALEDTSTLTMRRRPMEEIHADIEGVTNIINTTTSVISRLLMIQKRIDLNTELDGTVDFLAFDDGVNLQVKEDAFVEVAKSYSDRKGLTRKAWRQVKVPAAVLNRAGINR